MRQKRTTGLPHTTPRVFFGKVVDLVCGCFLHEGHGQTMLGQGVLIADESRRPFSR